MSATFVAMTCRPSPPLMEPWRPAFEFNIEGYPDEDFIDLVTAVRPAQCTLVPDGPGVFTSEEGWRLDAAQDAVVRDAIIRLKEIGTRPIVFIDPDPNLVKRVAATGAQGIEIYTGAYGAAFAKGDAARLLDLCAETAHWAAAYGLVVNVGHDLNLANLPSLVAAIPHLAEASIGHELTADALTIGWTEAIRAYRNALARPHSMIAELTGRAASARPR